MSQLISAFWIILELFFYQQFWSLFFQQRQSVRRYWIVLSVTASISAFVSFFEFPQPVYTITYLVSFTTVCAFLFSGSWLHHAIIVLIGFCVMSVFDTVALYGASLLLGVSASQLVMKKALYTILCSFERLFLILAGHLVKRARKPQTVRL